MNPNITAFNEGAIKSTNQRYVTGQGVVPVASTPTPVVVAPTTNSSTPKRTPSLLDTAKQQKAKVLNDTKSAQRSADSYAAQMRQARIDAINTSFAPRIQREQVEGEGRMSRVAALNFKSGVVGSGVDTTRTGEQKGMNDKALQAIEDEKAIAINEAFGWADKLGKERAALLTEQAQTGAEANVKYAQDKVDTAMKALDTFGAGGVSLETLKTKEPETYKNISEVAGMSDLQIASYLNSKSPTPSNVSTRVENGYLISSYYNEATRKFEHVTEKLPEGVNSMDTTVTQGDNGMIYVIDKSTGKVVNKVDAAKAEGDEPLTGEQLKQKLNKEISTPEFQALTPDEQTSYIRSQGGTPYDFGY